MIIFASNKNTRYEDYEENARWWPHEGSDDGHGRKEEYAYVHVRVVTRDVKLYVLEMVQTIILMSIIGQGKHIMHLTLHLIMLGM